MLGCELPFPHENVPVHPPIFVPIQQVVDLVQVDSQQQPVATSVPIASPTIASADNHCKDVDSLSQPPGFRCSSPDDPYNN